MIDQNIVTAVAATGSLGTGYLEETLAAAVESGADFIGCDAGSSDPGPYFLGSGQPKHSRETYVSDLRPMLRATLEHNIPVVIGTAGQAGTASQLAWTAQIIRELAKAEGMHFSLALINTELSKEVLHAALEAGRITPLGLTKPLTPQDIDNAAHVTAQMGAEPFEEVLRHGAQVVVAGRATDTSIFAAVPRMKGLAGGPTWHAAKVLECGAACVGWPASVKCRAACVESRATRVSIRHASAVRRGVEESANVSRPAIAIHFAHLRLAAGAFCCAFGDQRLCPAYATVCSCGAADVVICARRLACTR